jgi:mannose-6-phosphate isomerase-like protein (cupin superfamily)
MSLKKHTIMFNIGISLCLLYTVHGMHHATKAGELPSSYSSNDIQINPISIEPLASTTEHQETRGMVYYIVEGAAKIVVEGQAHEALAGSVWYIPAFKQRLIENGSEATLHYLTICHKNQRNIQNQKVDGISNNYYKVAQATEFSWLNYGKGVTLYNLLHPKYDFGENWSVDIQFCVGKTLIKPQCKSNVHRWATDTIYYIISGTGQLCIDDTTHKLEEGQSAFIPSHAKRSIENIGDIDLIYVSILNPHWEDNFEEQV